MKKSGTQRLRGRRDISKERLARTLHQLAYWDDAREWDELSPGTQAEWLTQADKFVTVFNNSGRRLIGDPPVSRRYFSPRVKQLAKQFEAKRRAELAAEREAAEKAKEAKAKK